MTRIAWDVQDLTPAQLEAVRTAARIEMAGQSFLNFARWIRPGFRVSWHHVILAQYLQAFAEGKIPRLMIFAPPRHGKSEMVSRILPAYIFATRPESSIIACSYSARLAGKMNVDAQRLIDSARWKAFRPDYGMGGSNARSGSFAPKRNSDEFEIQRHDTGRIIGSYSCAGVGGSVTGIGADFALVDDPIKDSKQASSAIQAASLWDWYGSTLYTRLQHPGSVLIMHTRWDETDLAGQLLRAQEKDPDADRWVVLNLPAIFDPTLPGILTEDPRKEGEALWPARFDVDRLRKIRASIGERWWSALYQGTPRVAEGSIFKREWLNFYNGFADFGGLNSLKEIVFSADLAFKGDHESDYVVMQVWGKTHGGDFFMLDQIRGQWDFVETLSAFEALQERWPLVRKMYLEDKANGSALGAVLKKRLGNKFQIVPVVPTTSKVLRYYAVQPLFESGRVYLPKTAKWLDIYLKEMLTVRGGPGNKIVGAAHDDQADATAQVLLKWTAGGEVDPMARLQRLSLISKGF